MSAATNQQVQNYSDQVVRPLSEALRAVSLACKNWQAQFSDIYANLTNNPTWTDGRTDGPPHLLTPSDILAINTFVVGMISICGGTGNPTNDANNMANAIGQWPIVLEACVQPVPAGAPK